MPRADTSAGTVLQALSAARHIDAAQLAAGELLRAAFVRTDTRCLHRAHRALGDHGYLLVRDVLGENLSLAQAAEVRGLRTRSEREYLGRQFRECLDCVAVEFGCATKCARLCSNARERRRVPRPADDGLREMRDDAKSQGSSVARR